MTVELAAAELPLSLQKTKGVGRRPPTGVWKLLMLFLELAASFFSQLPVSYDFANFVFYDPGASLRSDLLIAQGYVPTVDFGYPYGLLTLMIGRVFFAVIGRSPAAYLLFMFLAEAAIVWGMWRLAARWNWLIVGFLIAALPHAIIPVYVHLTHPLEAAFILHAIADIAAGRRARALALTTICLFIKPVMAYVLGLVLVIYLIVRATRHNQKWKSFVFAMRPAVIACAICLFVVAACFGLIPLANSLFPISGAKSYQALDFGLFGNGRSFWLPALNGAMQRIQYYLFTPAGFWILCTLLLALFSVHSALNLLKRSAAKHEAIVAIAACHFSFLFVFFGWPGSWTYYSSILVAGITLGLRVYRVRPAFILVLILVALAGHTQTIKIAINAWQWTNRSPETAMLWAHADQRDDWAHARAIAGTREIYYLNNGCPEVLFAGVSGPISFFLSPGSQTPKEFDLIRRQLEKAEIVVTFNQGGQLDPWYWPEFSLQRSAFVDVWSGKYLAVHERKKF